MNSLDWDEWVQLLSEEGRREDASCEIVDRYTQRLLRLVNSRLSSGLGRRLDAEDVVQSVFRSFFRRSDEFSFRRSGDLWRLLATIAVKKVRKQAARHGAEKRDFRKESHVANAAHRNLPFSGEPTPDHVVAIQETLDQVLQSLPTVQRRIFQMRLEGDSLAKISVELRKSQRTVRRVLQTVREQIVAALLDEDDQ